MLSKQNWDFINYPKNSFGWCSFRVETPTQALYLKTSKFSSPFNKTALENCIFISKVLKGLLPSVFDSWFKLPFESDSYGT